MPASLHSTTTVSVTTTIAGVSLTSGTSLIAGTITAPATPSAAPVSNHETRNLGLGLILGLILPLTSILGVVVWLLRQRTRALHTLRAEMIAAAAQAQAQALAKAQEDRALRTWAHQDPKYHRHEMDTDTAIGGFS